MICRVAAAVGLSIEITGRWRGGELDRLLDADHAALQTWMKERLQRFGWIVAAEVTYSRYGERGSIDLLAFLPSVGVLVVIEIKTIVADVGGLLRPLDAKVRLARGIARELGWTSRSVVPCLVLADQSTNRRRVADHQPLFERFSLRGRRADAWLRDPYTAGSGLLIFRFPSPSLRRTGRRAGCQRVRHARADRNVDSMPSSRADGLAAV